MGLERGLPAHGTRARYKHRRYPCHCDRCRAAEAKGKALERDRAQHRVMQLDLWGGEVDARTIGRL